MLLGPPRPKRRRRCALPTQSKSLESSIFHRQLVDALGQTVRMWKLSGAQAPISLGPRGGKGEAERSSCSDFVSGRTSERSEMPPAIGCNFSEFAGILIGIIGYACILVSIEACAPL